MSLRAASLRAVAAVLALAALSLFPAQALAQPQKIEVQARVIESFQPGQPDRRVFGALEFRGGLELTSPAKIFGGLSSIRITADGATFLAVTDKADWLRGRIVYREGRPAGIADAEMAPMLGADGRSLAARGWFDSEALALDGTIAHVAFERVHRILRFDLGKGGLSARGQVVATPADFGKMPNNRGVECLLSLPKGAPFARALLAISERALDGEGNIRAFVIGGPKPATFTIRRKNDFDVVDCALTPGADLLLLERFFTWRQGIAMRIRRVPLAALAPGALIDGPTLIEADMGYQIDNMEGLSVHRAADGAVVLTLVSDDNFSVFQRTLLLQFTLRD